MSERILIDERLEGENLILRARSMDDNAFVFEASRYPGFNDGMLWDPPDSVESLMPRYYGSAEAWMAGEFYMFTILDKRIGERRAGMITIKRTEEPDIWMLGYWTHPAHQGRGVMTEAVGLMVEFGFSKLEAAQVQASYATWNDASGRVLSKNGLVRVTRDRLGFEKHGKWVDEYLMAIDKKALLKEREHGKD